MISELGRPIVRVWCAIPGGFSVDCCLGQPLVGGTVASLASALSSRRGFASSGLSLLFRNWCSNTVRDVH